LAIAPTLLALSVGLGACGDKKKDEKKDDESSESSDSKEKKGKKKKKKDDDKPKQAAVEVVLPPVGTHDAKPGKLGDKEVKAELCKMDKAGSDMHDEWFHKALRDAALGPDGALYVLDHEVKVRKYVNQKPDGCELALDKTFGKDGILDIGFNKESFADKISVDKAGAVYVGDKKIVGGKVEAFCSDVVAGPDSATLLSRSKPVTDAKCEGKEIEWKGWDKDSSPDVLTVLSDTVIVKGSVKAGDKSVTKVGIQSPDGAQKTSVGKADGDEDICYAHGAAMCGGNLCVVDGNCKALRVWKPDGSFVGKLDLYDVTGLSIMPRIVRVGSKGEVFVIGSADGKDGDKEDHGVVVRLTGI
jgi:hypothetical protein